MATLRELFEDRVIVTFIVISLTIIGSVLYLTHIEHVRTQHFLWSSDDQFEFGEVGTLELYDIAQNRDEYLFTYTPHGPESTTSSVLVYDFGRSIRQEPSLQKGLHILVRGIELETGIIMCHAIDGDSIDKKGRIRTYVIDAESGFCPEPN